MHLVVLLFAMFASLFTLLKETLSVSPPFFLVGSRMAFAGIILLLYIFIFDRKNFKIKLAHLNTLILFSLSAIYITNVLEVWGLEKMISSKTCLLYSLSPFLAAIVAYFVLGEKINGKKWWGMLIGFIGLLPIIYSKTETETSSGMLSVFSYAEVAVFGAVLTSVYGWILLKKIISEYKYSPLMANGIAMTLGGGLALIHSYFSSSEIWDPIPILDNDLSAFVTLALMTCLISNIICYNLYGHLLKKFSATFMSFSGLVTPIFASLFGWLFLHETITWHLFASISLFSLGMLLFYQEEIKEGKLTTNAAPKYSTN